MSNRGLAQLAAKENAENRRCNAWGGEANGPAEYEARIKTALQGVVCVHGLGGGVGGEFFAQTEGARGANYTNKDNAPQTAHAEAAAAHPGGLIAEKIVNGAPCWARCRAREAPTWPG